MRSPSALPACVVLAAALLSACHKAPKSIAVPTPPAPAVCGNGLVEEGEQCDDGNADSADTCVSCQTVQCGGAVFTAPQADATKPFDLAGDFTVPTLDGAWTFKSHFTGCDSYVFIRHASNQYSDQLWNDTFYQLLDHSPSNVHYFFFSDSSSAAQEVQSLHDDLQSYFQNTPGGEDAWKDRVHFINVPTSQLTGWIPAMLSKAGFLTFAIDREQGLRETGLLGSPLSSSLQADTSYLAYQLQAFDFEFDRDQQLAQEQNVTLVPVTAPVMAANGSLASPSVVDVTLPNADQMAQFDTLEYDLTSGCKDNVDQNCPAWDQIGSLLLCSETPQAGCGNGTVDMGEDCDEGANNGAPGSSCTRFCEDASKPLHVCNQGIEIGRWITTYNRIGRWVTDASPMLAALASGGKRRLQYNSGGGSMATLTMRLHGSGSGPTPRSIQALWGGGSFDPSYNMQHQPITFTVPPGTSRVQFVAFVTGHGWGQNAENCAEFCDAQQHVAVNGHPDHVKDNPLAGTADGCQQQVRDGVIPNQYGTWPLGRDGWCPGLDVKPWVVDLTSEVNLTGTNTITYQALYMGKDYSPTPAANPNSQGFGANITMSSYLVFSQ